MGSTVVDNVVDGSVPSLLDSTPVVPGSVLVAIVGSMVPDEVFVAVSLGAGVAGEKHAGIDASAAPRKTKRDIVMRRKVLRRGPMPCIRDQPRMHAVMRV